MTNDLLDLLGHRNRWAVSTVLAYLMALSAMLIATLLAQVACNFQGRRWAEIAASAGAPLIGIALTQYAPPQDRLRIAIASAGLYCFGLVIFIAPLFAELLAQKSPELSWTRVVALSDMTWFAGPIIGPATHVISDIATTRVQDNLGDFCAINSVGSGAINATRPKQ